MRRLTIPAVLFAILALPIASAQATFHLEKVNEVVLASSGGDLSAQFLELYDQGGMEESFTPAFAPYGLSVYDAAGKPLPGDSQTLDATGLRNAAAADKQYLVSTPAADTAFGVTGDEKLTVSLPLSAGQACYTGMGGTPFSCVTWGCITHAVSTNSMGTGSAAGAVPPNGMSAQRQADDAIQIAAPTPKAPNRAGTSPAVCPGGGGAQFAGVKIPTQHVTAKKGKASIAATCPAKAQGSCDGKLVLKTAKAVTTANGKKKVLTLGKASFSIAAGAKGHALVKLSRVGRKALAKHGKLSAVATSTAHDGSGKSTVTAGKLTLRKAKKKHH
ncbi:MAG: hypothetical protein QOD53_537 [Thermoleophilaceae bacterium]|nr:hypothetical protein [Thermoleophilaceae bacterium]